MSAPLFSVDEKRPVSFKYSLAMHIMNSVAGAILDTSRPITTRIATAYTWFLFLQKIDPSLCDTVCGDSFEKNYKKWSNKELVTISRALSYFSSRLIKEIIKGEHRPEIRPPKL